MHLVAVNSCIEWAMNLQRLPVSAFDRTVSRLNVDSLTGSYFIIICAMSGTHNTTTGTLEGFSVEGRSQ